MSWIDNILSRFGIGGARVDTILEDRPFIAGEKIVADIMVHGGRHAQLIEGLHFVLYCSYEKTEFIDREYNEDDDYYDGDVVDVSYDGDSEKRTFACHAVLASFQLDEHFTIEAGETKRFQLDLSLPITTPQTRDRTRVWLSTELDIKRALDAKDKDYLEIKATPAVENVCVALAEIGFVLKESQCEATQIVFGSQLPFIQEFAFRPESGFFQDKYEELEVIFLEQAEHVEILIEKDRKAKDLQGWMSRIEDLDEVDIRHTFSLEELQSPELSEQLYQLLFDQL